MEQQKQLKLEIFQQIEDERKLAERNKRAALYSRKCNREKAKAKLVLSIIGQTIIALPVFWGLLVAVSLI